jgi:16S rRNA (guanine527-N7)-methyltransferase
VNPLESDYYSALLEAFPEDSHETLAQAARFGAWLGSQNQTQNLTRMSSPADFASSHYSDTRALLQSDWLAGLCVDLGSGGGVPGLLAAALEPSHRDWLLIESELRKAEHLRAGVEMFHVEQTTRIEHSRIERIIQSTGATTLVARALGRVDRILGWTERCSTWNSMILFKSRGWEEEWAEFQRGRHANQLTIAEVKDYSALGNCRLLIRLLRC